jgi:hypothetical protein
MRQNAEATSKELIEEFRFNRENEFISSKEKSEGSTKLKNFYASYL